MRGKDGRWNVYGVELFTTWRVRLARFAEDRRPIRLEWLLGLGLSLEDAEIHGYGFTYVQIRDGCWML